MDGTAKQRDVVRASHRMPDTKSNNAMALDEWQKNYRQQLLLLGYEYFKRYEKSQVQKSFPCSFLRRFFQNGGTEMDHSHENPDHSQQSSTFINEWRSARHKSI